MLRGILETRSADINNFQKFIDPFVLVNLSFLVFKDNQIVVDINYLIIFLIDFLVLNFSKIYISYRIRSLLNIIPRIIFITTFLSLINTFLVAYSSLVVNSEIIKFFTLTFIYLFFHHFILRYLLRYMRTKGYNSRNVIFFGNKNSFCRVQKELSNTPWMGYRIKYWFSPNSYDYNEKMTKKTINLLCNGGIKELVKVIEENKDIEKIFFTHHDSDDISLDQITKLIGDTCVPASFIFDWNILSMSLKKEFFGDLVALNIWNPEDSFFNENIKRGFDFASSIILSIISFPLILIIALAIKFSSKGPIFFTQYRYGKRGEIFKMYKFRTMYISKYSENISLEQAKKYDERITNVGKFLRKYSLDELPQLINVIKGEMSLVGPRPHAVEHNEYYRKLITGYMQRHSKLPGMTGLAQINGARGETSNIELMELRIKFDIEYTNQWSLYNDFLILIKTFFSVIKGQGS